MNSNFQTSVVNFDRTCGQSDNCDSFQWPDSCFQLTDFFDEIGITTSICNVDDQMDNFYPLICLVPQKCERDLQVKIKNWKLCLMIIN